MSVKKIYLTYNYPNEENKSFKLIKNIDKSLSDSLSFFNVNVSKAEGLPTSSFTIGDTKKEQEVNEEDFIKTDLVKAPIKIQNQYVPISSDEYAPNPNKNSVFIGKSDNSENKKLYYKKINRDINDLIQNQKFQDNIYDSVVGQSKEVPLNKEAIKILNIINKNPKSASQKQINVFYENIDTESVIENIDKQEDIVYKTIRNQTKNVYNKEKFIEVIQKILSEEIEINDQNNILIKTIENKVLKIIKENDNKSDSFIINDEYKEAIKKELEQKEITKNIINQINNIIKNNNIVQEEKFKKYIQESYNNFLNNKF